MPFPLYEKEISELKHFLFHRYGRNPVPGFRIDDYEPHEMDAAVWTIEVIFIPGCIGFVVTNMDTPTMKRIRARTSLQCVRHDNLLLVQVRFDQIQLVGELVVAFKLLAAEEGCGATHYKALRAAASLEQFTHHLDQFEIEDYDWDDDSDDDCDDGWDDD